MLAEALSGSPDSPESSPSDPSHAQIPAPAGVEWKDIKSILVVDDDADLLAAVARLLRGRNIEVRTAPSYEAGLAELSQRVPDLALIDVCLGDLRSGLQLLVECKRIAPQTRVIVLSGHPSREIAADSIRLGAVNYVAKTEVISEIIDKIWRPASVAVEPRAVRKKPLKSLEDVSREHILSTLKSAGGNVSMAARRLKMHRRTLQRILRRIDGDNTLGTRGPSASRSEQT